MKRYRTKKLSVEQLQDTEGKVATENLFNRDARMARLFVNYMLKNIKYMRKYEHDTGYYDEVADELADMLKTIDRISNGFIKHQKKG